MIDLKRSAIYTNLGVFEVAAACGNFESGTILQKVTETGTTKLTICDGTAPAGIAKFDNMSGMVGVIVGEAITFPLAGGANVSVTLKHPSLVASMYKVESAIGGANYAEGAGADYTMNTVNGVITRVNATSTIPDGGTVYVTYKWNKTDAEIDAGEYPYGLIGGRNLRNSLDDVVGSNRMTLIQGFSIVVTTCYNTTEDYTVNKKLYSDANGLFTMVAGGNPQIGTVHSIPNAGDVFLGVELQGFVPGI